MENLNRVIGISDAQDVMEKVQFDDKDRAVVVEGALQQAVKVSYDANGNLISMTDEAGETTNFSNDVYRTTAVRNALVRLLRPYTMQWVMSYRSRTRMVALRSINMMS